MRHPVDRPLVGEVTMIDKPPSLNQQLYNAAASIAEASVLLAASYLYGWTGVLLVVAAGAIASYFAGFLEAWKKDRRGP